MSGATALPKDSDHLKKMRQIPVLISIPHGGTDIPPELINCVCIPAKDIFDDSDPFTREIYDLEPWVLEAIDTDIARAFVDLNRAVDDLPPKNPDGIIKSMTCYKKPIYIKGKEPDESLRQTLIQRYYLPYHKKIQEITNQNKELKLALDCHSMAAEPPPIAPDIDRQKKSTNEKFLQGGARKAQSAGRKASYKIDAMRKAPCAMRLPPGRPLICLGNAHGKACDQDVVKKLAGCFCEAFELVEKDVVINQPFAGGYITRTYGNNPLPWVQVEMNRSLYLSSPWFDPITLQVDNHQLMELNDRFKTALELYFK
jgi:formiminoglutamase